MYTGYDWKDEWTVCQIMFICSFEEIIYNQNINNKHISVFPTNASKEINLTFG